MPCCGLFKRKDRSKSVPPGGTQVKDDKKGSKKSYPKDINQSQPNLSEHRRQIEDQNNSHLKDILVNARNHDKQIEDEALQIYPVPPEFQSPRASQYSREPEYDDDDDDKESEEDDDTKQQRQSITRSQENIDFLNELNKDLQDELKLRLAAPPPKKPERTANDLGESGLESSGNVTIKTGQNQNQEELVRSRASAEAPGVNTNNTVNIIRSQSNLNQTNVTSRDFDLSNVHEMSITSLQKLIETVNMDKNTVDTVKQENMNLKSLIEDLKSEMLAREAKYKEENDALMSKIHQTLTKEAKSDSERDELVKLLASKQQHANESLIQEQTRLIDSLRTRCEQYERALAAKTGSVELQVKEYKDEITTLRAIVHRLSAELSSFQCKYPQESPSLQASLKKIELTPLPSTGPTPIWLINTKFLSPLIAAYDDRLIEKDEKLRLFKKKLNELTAKFEMILNENKELNSKLEKAYSLGRVNDTEGFNEINNIRNQAILVLEENKTMQEQVDLLKSKLIDAQKNSIIEINNLSKKIIVLDSEKLDLRNQFERLKLNYDDLTRRYNDVSTEAQSRVRLQEHLSQTGELKRKIDELDVYHKYELEQTGSKISTLEGEKKDLMIRNASLTSENKRLLAENKVLDKALNDGIGRKTQSKIQQLEKRVEMAEMKERTAVSVGKKLEKEIEKLTIEREALLNSLKEAEIEMKKHQNRLAEENLKLVKMETKLEDFKDKSAQKLANVNEKLKKKDSEFGLVKLESDKRLADILNLLHKKQNEIDDLIKEKRQMEGELEMVWQSTMNENRNMRNTFLDINRKLDDKLFSSSDYRLLLDD